MTTLAELMEHNWLVGSFDGHAIFWNHSSTFTTYRISDDGKAEAITTNTAYAPAHIDEPKKIRWAIFTGRELAAELSKDINE